MELTWEPGLLTVGDTLNKNREQKQREQKQSAWEKYLEKKKEKTKEKKKSKNCLLYTSPSPRDRQKSRMPSSA